MGCIHMQQVMKCAHGISHVCGDDKCVWGAADYFAVDASYSVDAAHILANGNKQVLLLEVSRSVCQEGSGTESGLPPHPSAFNRCIR